MMLRNLSGRLKDDERVDNSSVMLAQPVIKSNGFVETAPIHMPELNGKGSKGGKIDSNGTSGGHTPGRNTHHTNGYNRLANGDAHEHDVEKRAANGGHNDINGLMKIKSPRQNGAGVNGVNSIRGLLTAILYGGLSIASVFLNKAIFKVYNFDFPATLVTGKGRGQEIVSALSSLLHFLPPPPPLFFLLVRVLYM